MAALHIDGFIIESEAWPAVCAVRCNDYTNRFAKARHGRRCVTSSCLATEIELLGSEASMGRDVPQWRVPKQMGDFVAWLSQDSRLKPHHDVAPRGATKALVCSRF
ncbi:hypothetical protein E2C01_068033 [Portunus trituberculatus]|uniref:Uncharacterized protein n=1 Tax=Portunus trituberculatus TaxID=210409 RepID=A0A5B7HWT9_PORTR|nr:hypothetical protein [Portunus trituberculatus]